MIKYDDVINNNFVLSPHQLQLMEYSNKNVFKLKDLLSRQLSKKDNGVDIGSANYIKGSSYKFLKTKCANKDNYVIDVVSEESFEYMNYKAFVNQNLKKGDLLISKDSNIGETCILDDDYPNCMIASAFYKLPLEKNKYYIFSFLKTDFFKSQLDLMVPRGATIRHAGTRFLDCKVPFPSGKDSTDVVNKIETLTKNIIAMEKQVRQKEQEIFNIIDNELRLNSFVSSYYLPKFNDLLSNNRIDAGYYCSEYKNICSLITNYKYGSSNLEKFGYSISRGQNLQVSCIGKSIESDRYCKGFYKIAKPTNLSDYGTVVSYNYLGNKNDLSLLKNGDIVFSAEGTIGKCAMFNNINDEKVITNIHGIILNKLNHDVIESGYVCCFLRYLRKIGFFDYLSVGGQGGSLAMKYWDDVLIPLFPHNIMQDIYNLYCSSDYESIISLSDKIKETKTVLNKIFELIVCKDDIQYSEIESLITCEH